MTISTETTFIRTAGNGVTTAFSFPYHFFENGDLLVYLEVIATGAATLQTIDTHYTVSGADDPGGGTVTFLSAPADTVNVVIIRKPDFSQTVNLTSFVAGTINDALDRIYEHLQYQEFRNIRAISLPDTAAAADLVLPHTSERAGKLLGFDDDGDLELYDGAVGADSAVAAAASALAAANSAAAAANSATAAQNSANAASGSASDAAADALAADNARLAAVAAQGAAETAAGNASTSAANASSSASSASTSASNAATSEGNAATSESNAAASASAALNSRNAAEGFADDAANSAAAALASEQAAQLAETNAETAENNAEIAQAAAEAAQTATYLARDVAQAASENPGITLHFDSSTTDSDPGTGDFRFNNATLASVTEIYIDNADVQGSSIAAYLNTFDDNNFPDLRGTIVLKGVTSDTAFFIGEVSGSVVDGTGYRKITVAHVSSAATFTNGDTFSMIFLAAGNVGEVQGPDSTTDHAVARWNGTDGSALVDSGVIIDDSDNVTGIADLTMVGDLDVTGNIAVSGTVDGRDVAADGTKLDFITVTQAVDLDAIETRVNSLDTAVVLRGTWDASSGSFPGSGSAQAGDSYIVSVGGTVDSVVFNAGDRIIAITDNASTSTFAANWFKADYTDLVSSVAGKTGVVTLQVADITDMSANGRSLVSAANYAAMKALLDLEIGTDVQAYDATLDAFAAYNTNGLVTQTSANTFTGRTITAGNGISVANGDGVSGNPTVTLAAGVRNIADITGGDTIIATDRNKLVRIASGTGTLAFTAAATLGSTFDCVIKNVGTGDVTLDPNSTETIDGVASWILYPGGSIRVYCDGSNFYSVILQPMVKVFDGNGTFTKPGSASTIEVEAWGGGGSGGCGQSGVGAGGGGGGGYNFAKFSSSQVGATETVTIGTGGASVSSTGNGNTGNNTTFGSLLTAYGGGGGVAATPSAGGGGGGALSAASGSTGGEPRGDDIGAAYNAGWGGPNGVATVGSNGRNAGYGGASGGSGDSATGGNGGNSLYGGGGGGAGGDTTAGGNGGTSSFGGNGGAGATGSANATAGTQPGGGGGGSENTGTVSGAGAAGRCRMRVS